MSADRESLDRRWSAHLSTLFRELPLTERPAAAAAAGFQTVESWWPGSQLDPWIDEVRRHHLQVACLNADAGDLEAGERGYLNDPSRRRWVLDAVETALQAAVSIGARMVNVLPGRRIDGLSEAAEWTNAVEILREASDRACEAGISIVVEHLNPTDVPGSFLPDPASVLRLLEEVGAARIYLLLDAYHAVMAGLDPGREATVADDAIGHVQFSWVPHRREPDGDGRRLTELAGTLREVGYHGPIGFEVIPRESTAVAVPALFEAIADAGA